MTNPTDVKHSRFPVGPADVVYDDGEFSVAVSVWDDEHPAVGVRWNHSQGGGGSGIGFPNSRSKPSWFILPEFIGLAVLRGLSASSYEGKDSARIAAAIHLLDGTM